MVEANRRQLFKLSVSRAEIIGLNLNRLYHADGKVLCIRSHESTSQSPLPTSIPSIVNALKVNRPNKQTGEKVSKKAAGGDVHGVQPKLQTARVRQPTSPPKACTANNIIPDWQKELRVVIGTGTEFVSASAFNDFISSRLQECSIDGISDIFRILGKKATTKNHLVLKRHLPALATRLGRMNSNWRLKEISLIVYGLQCFGESDKGYLDIIRIVSTFMKQKLHEEVVIYAGSLSMMCLGLQSNKFRRSESVELLSLLPHIVGSCPGPLSAQSIASILYGLQGMSSRRPETLALLKVLTPKIKFCAEVFTPQHVGNCLYALQGLNSGHKEVISFLAALVRRVESCTESLSCQELSNAMYGLRGLNSHHTGIIPLLMAMIKKVQECNEPFNAQAVGNVLYGLQGMKSDQTQVLNLIAALAPKILACDQPLSAQSVGTALYGLQGLSSTCEEVRLLLSAVTVQVNKNVEPLGGILIGNACYGLRNMSSEHAEVRELLVAITSRVRTCDENLESMSIASALYGLQSLTSDHVEVLHLLSALEEKVRTCIEPFNDKEIGTSFCGMQGMKGDHPEVLSMLLAITKRIEGPLSARALGMSLYGINGLLETPEARPLLHLILKHALKIEDCDFKSPIAAQSLGQAICYALPSLRRTMDEKKMRQWEERLNAMRRNFKRFEIKADKETTAQFVEKGAFNVIVDALKDTDIIAFSRTYLCDFFECDIVLTIPATEEKEAIVINIEIDGNNHAEQKKLRFTNLRDVYLRSRGVIVIRLDDIKAKTMWSGELRDSILNAVEEIKQKRDE
jgi:hypothetical protein